MAESHIPMENLVQIDASREVLDQSQVAAGSHEVEVCGLTFVVDPGVFSPKYFGSTHIFTAYMPFERGERFLEIGCGPGITAVFAALRGAESVVAVDINPAAVANTRKNATRHHMDDILDARVSDVFGAVGVDETFDTIYWNLPFIYVRDDYQYKSLLERALFDPGYQYTERFLAQSRQHLTKSGHLLVGFGDFGDESLLQRLCERFSWRSRELARGAGVEGGAVQFMLLELTPA